MAPRVAVGLAVLGQDLHIAADVYVPEEGIHTKDQARPACQGHIAV